MVDYAGNFYFNLYLNKIDILCWSYMSHDQLKFLNIPIHIFLHFQLYFKNLLIEISTYQDIKPLCFIAFKCIYVF